MKLTTTQQEAVEFDGNAVIVAAAGSGKTLVLVEKIAWLVQQRNIPLPRILVTTFTEKAAEELRRRLAKRLHVTQTSLKEAYIGTMHGFCARLLREQNPADEFTILEDFLARLEQVQTTRKTLLELLEAGEEQTLSLVEEFGFHRTVKILMELLPKPSCRFPFPNPLSAVRLAYAAKKQIGKQHRLDFNDLEIQTNQLLQDPSHRARWQKNFDYLLIDEFQDINPIQWRILSQLHATQNRLVVVGDPQQSIYRFRGAEAALFHQAAQHIQREGRLFYLGHNFRSSPEIIHFINQVGQGLFPNYQPMISSRPSTAQQSCPHVLSLPSSASIQEFRELEAAEVAAHILHLHAQGIPFTQIALLFRTRKAMPLFAQQLTSRHIPFQMGSRGSLLETPIVQMALHFLKVVHGTAKPISQLLTLLSPFIGLSLEEVYLRESLVSETPPELTPDLEFKAWLELFFQKMTEKVPTGASREALEDLRQLIQRILPLGIETRDDLIRILDDLTSENTYIPLSVPEQTIQGVSLLTVHGAKGMEFSTVFLCDLKGKPRGSPSLLLELPNGDILLPERATDSQGLLEQMEKSESFLEAEALQKAADELESKRLLYVAMTRAIDRLILPLENSGASGKREGSAWSHWLTKHAAQR